MSNQVSAGNRYEVRVDWATVAPRGDTLEVNAVNGVDERWVEALEVVLDEHQHQISGRQWCKFDFDYEPGEKGTDFVLYIKGIEPGVQSIQVRQTVNELVKSANSVAQVGTHVYDLARELRGEPDGSRESTPPPGLDPLLDELRADAA